MRVALSYLFICQIPFARYILAGERAAVGNRKNHHDRIAPHV